MYVPTGTYIDTDRDVLKQLTKQNLNEKCFFKISDTRAMPLKTIKSFCTRTLNKQFNLFKIPNVPRSNSITDMDHPAFCMELDLMNHNPNKEAHTYGVMNTLLASYFPLREGFVVVPQSVETDGEVDFLIKHMGVIRCVVECKSEKGGYSLTQAYSQGIQYANNNRHVDDCYVIINKGPFISVGAFIQDYHSSHPDGSYSNKAIMFDGYIGLEVGPTGVKPVGQKNTIYPQHKLYKMGTSEENSDILSLLLHVKNNNISHDDYPY